MPLLARLGIAQDRNNMPKKGNIPWNKGMTMSEDQRKAFRVPHIGSGIYKRNKTHWNKGGKLSEKHKDKLKENHADFSGEKNPVWKGENVCYAGMHSWITKMKGRPSKCEHCGKTDLRPRQYNWANIDHLYRRKLDDYIRLCTKCHRKYDYEKL